MKRALLLAVTLAACSSSSEPTPDSGGTNASGITCDNVEDRFASYVALHSECTTVDDCTSTGGAGTCDCTSFFMLGGGSGTGIRKDATAGLKDFYAVAATCSGHGICDAAPSKVVCDHGQCVVPQRSCLDFDSGAPDTKLEDASETSVDASDGSVDASEVATETGSDAAFTCDSVQTEFAAYRAAHDGCTLDDECTSVGGAASCECSRSLGDGSGNGIRKDAAAGATKYSAFFYASCTTPAVCDAAPGTPRCISGHCSVSMASCLGPKDSGPG
jgi:hypothetical protein